MVHFKVGGEQKHLKSHVVLWDFEFSVYKQTEKSVGKGIFFMDENIIRW